MKQLEWTGVGGIERCQAHMHTILLFCLVCVVTTQAGIQRIWAVDDGEKVRRDDRTHPLSAGSQGGVWTGDTIKLFAARNEILAFQLIIEADGAGADRVDVTVSDLVNGTHGIKGSSYNQSAPYDYRGKGVELFTEHYLDITDRSTPSWFYDTDARPSGYYTGKVPDALIPLAAPQGKGGTPFAIPANRNQGVWADIYVPRDARGGVYAGVLTVKENADSYAALPLVLTVYGFVLSDTTHLTNMFGLNPGRIESDFGLARRSKGYFAVLEEFQKMAHRHRFNLVHNVANLSEMSTYHKGAMTGELYTDRNSYDGPGEGVGNGLFAIALWGYTPEEYGTWEASGWTEAGFQAGADAWAEWFAENAPAVKIVQQLYPDEPYELNAGSTVVDTVKMQADWIHKHTGPGGVIPTFVTSHITAELRGYVDVWSTGAHRTHPSATRGISGSDVLAERSQGRKWGYYNGYRPLSGAVIIDADAVEFRVIPWICWKHDVDHYFYWGTNWGPDGESSYAQPISLDWGSDRANGDGTFFYPGTETMYGLYDLGLPGPVSSIRMKNWRRGAQDYEYLWVARKAGLTGEVEQLVGRCVPTALWESSLSGDVSWSNRGSAFEAFRRELAVMIEERLNAVTNRASELPPRTLPTAMAGRWRPQRVFDIRGRDLHRASRRPGGLRVVVDNGYGALSVQGGRGILTTDPVPDRSR